MPTTFSAEGLDDVDLSGFLDVCASNNFKAARNIILIGETISTSPLLGILSEACGMRFSNEAQLLQLAPFGIVQAYLIFNRNINHKISGEFTITELLLNRPDIDAPATRVILNNLIRRNYAGFNMRLASGLSLLEETCKNKSLEIANEILCSGIKISNKAVFLACTVDPGNRIAPSLDLITSLCKIKDTIPTKAIINAVIHENDAATIEQKAMVIVRILSEVKSPSTISLSIPEDILSEMAKIDFKDNCMLMNVYINNKHISNTILSDSIVRAIVSPPQLMRVFSSGNIREEVLFDAVSATINSCQDVRKKFALVKYFFRSCNSPRTSHLLSNITLKAIKNYLYLQLCEIEPILEPRVEDRHRERFPEIVEARDPEIGTRRRPRVRDIASEANSRASDRDRDRGTHMSRHESENTSRRYSEPAARTGRPPRVRRARARATAAASSSRVSPAHFLPSLSAHSSSSNVRSAPELHPSRHNEDDIEGRVLPSIHSRDSSAQSGIASRSNRSSARRAILLF